MRALVIVAFAMLGGSARADCEIEHTAGPIAHIEFIEGKRVIVIEPRILCTTVVPRPSVVYVADAKTIHYEWEAIRADLLPVILSTVKKAPF